MVGPQLRLPRMANLLTILNSSGMELATHYTKAKSLTQSVFGDQRTLFNPIYVSNVCLADCGYCGYRVSNRQLQRITLAPFEAVREARFLKDRGIKNILVLAGEYPHEKYLEMLLANISAIKGAINPDWLGVEIAALETVEYRQLKNAGIDSVTIFQETYDRNRYRQLHLNRIYKGDFDFRLTAPARALEAGIGEVGLGVLYGINRWKQDTIAMAEHAKKLLTKYPGAKLRFSFPRLQPSMGQSEDCRTEHVSEEHLLRAVIGIRVTFPNSSLVLTGRESVHFLAQHAAIVNVLGYSGSTVVGGYSIHKGGLHQFTLDSQNDFEDFVLALRRAGYGLSLAHN